MTEIYLSNIEKTYKTGKSYQKVLCGLCLEVNKGDSVAIMGESGSGKSTLLNVMGGLDFPTGGEFYFQGKPVSFANHNDSSKFRRDNLGIIVQNFALINELNVFDNVSLPLWQGSFSKKEIKFKVNKVLERVKMIEKAHRDVHNLSGGEKQRVAIARACVMNPSIILADEPTGSLDSNTESIVMDLLMSFHRDGKTIILVTHDSNVASTCSKNYILKNGTLNEHSLSVTGV